MDYKVCDNKYFVRKNNVYDNTSLKRCRTYGEYGTSY